MVTGVVGAGQVFPAGSPFDTQTMTFPMVLPLPRTSISFSTGAECFLAHTGSASMVSGLRVGAFPSKVTVPVMDEAATATPGQTDIATSPAASHNLFPDTRMLDSLVIANLVSLVIVDAACRPPWSGATLHRARRLCNPSTSADRSGVLERDRFGKPRVAQWNERLPSHQPARRRHEAPADSNERGHVQRRRTEPLGMERRHDLPVEIEEVHGEEPRSPDGQGRSLP